MKAILGKHYEGHQIVSAQAAFYGLSSALLPESDFYKNKQKFLEFFKVEELLLKSHFKQLGEFIAETLLENSRKKIIESNCNKALKVIEKLQKTITTTIDRQIKPTIKELENAQLETCDNLDYSRDKFVSNLRNSAFDAIDRFKSDLREEMYAYIDIDRDIRGIENKRCKKIYENKRKQGMEELGEDMKKRFEKNGEQFRKDLQKDVEQFEDRIENFLERLKCINIDYDFDDHDFDRDPNIKKKDLLELWAPIASLIFGISNFWNFVGWASIGSGLAGIGRLMWSSLSPSYKKSQQKKTVDKILDKDCEIIEEQMINQLKSYKKIIFEKVENLKAGLNDPVVGYKCMREGLIKAGEGLWQISNNIKTRIAQ
ncbi:hypothetical protein [Helicobacter pylori]|uniref:hypothetical protein n=1 Tax=Helicobacter pylori TaxID=210 RepID=UPI0027E59504|nr:hypothetical protein [Helicobacter pylori]